MEKIIWNITKKCGFHCRICATQSDERKELSYDEKRNILLKICSMKPGIVELDFAGGDPLYDKDSRKIIEEAINILGKDTICVTTTGIGINQLRTEEKKRYLYKCELSLDNIGNSDMAIRKEDLYSIKNLEAIYKNKKHMKDLTINIPILNTNLQHNSIDELICIINRIDVERLSVNILRYMPVGKAGLCDYPQFYEPEKYIDYIQENLRNDVNVHIHCAMRGLRGENNNCNMFTKKVGIDCEGNIFMCAWAGYLSNYKEKNPFFLGNMLEQDFHEILESEKMNDIKSNLKNNRKCCCIFSYLKSNNHDMFSNLDPLYKRGVK